MQRRHLFTQDFRNGSDKNYDLKNEEKMITSLHLETRLAYHHSKSQQITEISISISIFNICIEKSNLQ